MTVDSSALISVLLGEPGYLELVDRMLAADPLRIGTPTLVETTMVLGSKRGRPAETDVDDLIRELAMTVVPFGEVEWRIAADAFERFGRGRHAARLNFGDCLAYATAAAAGDTLLFVGDDFTKTDITPA